MITFKQFLTESTEHEKCLTQGTPNNCYENARKEYHAHKAAGHDPKYHVGNVVGHSIDDDKNKHPQSVPHVWVTVGNKIHDPTPFKHGHGNYKDLSSKPSHEYWTHGTKYNSSYEVHHDKLHHEFKNFPKKD